MIIDASQILAIVANSLGVVSAIYGVYKAYSQGLFSTKSERRRQYKFIKKFYRDLENEKNKLHPNVIEEGYYVISGKRLRHVEVLLLKEFPHSYRALRCYASSQKYIEVRDKVVKYKEKYKLENDRKFVRARYFLLYFIFAFIAFLPFIVPVEAKTLSEVLLKILFMFSFILLAALNLLAHANMGAAKYVIEEQKKIIESEQLEKDS